MSKQDTKTHFVQYDLASSRRIRYFNILFEVMDSIPQDVWPVIAKFMDDKTKRQMRLANTKWFNVIKYNNYVFNFTRKEEIEAITERLSRYSWPIELKMANLKFSALELLDYLPKLTMLTKINIIERTSNEEAEKITEDQWMKLSTLTKLQIARYLERHWPPKILECFTNLTKWTFSETEDLRPLLKLQPNLNSVPYSHPWPISALPNPEKLTTLRIELIDLEQARVFSRLTNLKRLLVNYFANEPLQLDISGATQLEELALFSSMEPQFFPSLAISTNLTNLKINCSKWSSKNAEEISKFNLKSLSFFIPDSADDAHLDFLSHLTQLGFFHLDNLQVEPNPNKDVTNAVNQVYNYVPQCLTQLIMDTRADLGRLSHLTNLKALTCGYSPVDNVQYLSLFSNLTSLLVSQMNEAVDWSCLATLTQLEELTLHEIWNEGAVLNDNFEPYEPNTCDFLSNLTNLTSLKVRVHCKQDSFWHNLQPLTKLQALSVRNMDKEERLTILTAFTNLTMLGCGSHVAADEFTGDHLTVLTSLQELICHGVYDLVEERKDEFFAKMPRLVHFSVWEPDF